MMRKILSGLTLAVVALAPAVALAHPGHGGGDGGFAHGFLHPITGLDHMLAMVMVGILAYQLGGRALWLVPSSFLAVMAVGGLMGIYGLSFYYLEPGIAASVVVLGAIVALALRTPVALAVGLVAIFAIFHGYAHGIEVPIMPSPAAYAAGFMVSTALLHCTGIALGMLVGRLSQSQGQLGYRVAGSAVAITGLVLLTSAIA
jgi:urease accessory protein